MSLEPAPPGPTPAHAQRGAIVAGKYRVEEVLGHGGMGIVVRATHLQLGGGVALKFLHHAFAENINHVERFLREARAASRIQSEHVARVFDVGTLPTGEPFMVLELLDGSDLNRMSKERGPLPIAEAVDYVAQASLGIAEAHRAGIIHRDLKPGNLFVAKRTDGSTVVKVLDFGISKVADGSDQSLTATGDVLGSPMYMSPEQIRDSRGVTAASDIWALGTILHRLLVGRPPFAGSSSSGTLASIIADPAPRVRVDRPDVSPALEAVILRCLDKNAAGRFQTADQLAAALLESVHTGGAPTAAYVEGDTAQASSVSLSAPTAGTRWQDPLAPAPVSRVPMLMGALAGVALAGVLVGGFLVHRASTKAEPAARTAPALHALPVVEVALTSQVRSGAASNTDTGSAELLAPPVSTASTPTASATGGHSLSAPVHSARPRVAAPDPTFRQATLPRYGQD